MKSKEKLESDLSRIVNAIIGVEGVIAVILFGSRAKGTYDEYSDYDLLVVFEDDELMWRNRRKLYENVGKLGLFTQVLARSMRELRESTDPTFLRSIFEQGITLYMRYPLKAPAFLQELRPMAIVRYNLKSLNQKEKMRVIYRLYGKGRLKGVVQRNGGRRLGDGCFLIPEEGLEEVLDILKHYSIEFEVMRVYA